MFVHTMNTVLILVALGVVCAVLGVVVLWFRSSQATDLGSVSHTWVAELRAGEPYDSSR
jgi:ABC-type Mn2+/Zn2+ transport system permease subunit